MDKPLRGLIAGAAIGLVVVIIWAVYDIRQPSSAEQRRKDANAFVTAWKKSRLEDFRATSKVVRTRNGHVLLTRASVIDQNPPRFASISSEATEIILPGKLINCTAQGDKMICGTDESISWDDKIARETEALRGYFFSAAPIYEVDKDGNCYTFVNIYPSYPSPPYGKGAKFCFNDKGILVRLEVNYGEIKDVRTYENIESPKNSDFDIPDGKPIVVNE